MGGDDHAAPAEPSLEDGQSQSLYRRMVGALFRLTPWGVNRRIDDLYEVAGRLGGHLAAVDDRLDAIEEIARSIQEELSVVRDKRVGLVEERVDGLERAAHVISEEAARLRDRVVPAAVARSDALLDRLAEELEEVGSLVERSIRREPLPAPVADGAPEAAISNALSEVQPLLLESFRGSEEEIQHRLDLFLPDLREAAPVLDLGCGRGELLVMLREAGVASSGVEGDDALASAAIRRGLEVARGDVLDHLRKCEDGSFGAVTALHLFEHLPPAQLAEVLAEARRVLRPGGLLIAECPNPHSLRVGASLYWQDPTHQRPLLPETLDLFLRAAGFEVTRTELLHPFPEDQLLMDDEGGTDAVTDADLTTLAERIDRLRKRLDEILNGPRDFAVWAASPDNPSRT